MEEKESRIDKAGMDSAGQTIKVFPSGDSPPDDAAPFDASVQVTGTDIQPINLDESKKTTFFKANQNDEQWIYDHIKTVVDPSSIQNSTIFGAVYVRGSEPTAADAYATLYGGSLSDSGLVFNHKEYFELISPATSNLRGTLWFYGETTSADDLIFPKVRTETDPNDIESKKITGALFTTGSPPDSDPDAPAGLKIDTYIDLPQTNAGASNLSLRLYSYAKLDSLDRIILNRIKTTIDAQNINCTAVRLKAYKTTDSVPTSPASPPTNNVKVLYTEDETITPVIDGVAGVMVRIWYYGPKDSKDEKILERYSTTTDGSALPLTSRAFRSYLDGDAMDSTISDGKGASLVTVNTEVFPVTLLLGVNRTLSVREFGLGTPQQSKEIEGFKDEIDGGNTPIYISDTAVRFKYWSTTTGSPPTGPDNPPENNTKLLTWTDAGVPDNPDLRNRIFIYGSQTSADKLVIGSVFPRHRFETVTDTSGLESSAVRACVVLDGGSSTNPSTVNDANGNTLVATKTYVHPQSFELPLHNASLIITEYALVSSKQAEEFRETVAITNPLDLYRRRTASIVPWTDTDAALADSLYGANKADPTFEQATAQLKTPQRAIQIIESTNEDQKQHSGTVESRDWPFRGKPQAGFGAAGGFGDPNSYIFIRLPGTATGGGALLYGVSQHTFWRRNRGSFKIRRRIITSSAADPFLPQRGTVCDAPFRGYATHQVMYTGAEILFNSKQGDNHLMIADLCFDTDDMMFMNDGLLPDPGNRLYVADTLGGLTRTGFYDPSIFSETSGVFVLSWPAVSNFNSFGVANS
jgi:hypothetical protein